MTLMTAMSDEIGKLIEALGLKHVTELQISVKAGDFVTVDARMYPEEGGKIALHAVFQRFVLIERDTLKEVLGLLHEASSDYNSPNFTDRHQMGPRLKELLRKLDVRYDKL